MIQIKRGRDIALQRVPHETSNKVVLQRGKYRETMYFDRKLSVDEMYMLRGYWEYDYLSRMKEGFVSVRLTDPEQLPL